MNQYSYLKWIDWLSCWDFVCEWDRTAVEWLLRKHPALFIPFIVVSLGSNMLSLIMSQLLTTVWNSCCDCLQEQFWVTYENQSHCCIIRGFQLKIVLPSLISHFSHQTWPPVTFGYFQWLHLLSKGWKSVTKEEKTAYKSTVLKMCSLPPIKFTSGSLFWGHNCVFKILTTRTFSVAFFCNSDG